MPINPWTGEWEDELPPDGPSAPPTPPTTPPYVPPTNAPNTHGLDYWATRGIGPQNMFDANGQLLPQWVRTGTGYELRDEPKYVPDTPFGGGGGDFGGDVPNGPKFNWSQFNPAEFSFENYKPQYAPYVSTKYESPSIQDAENEPGYAFGRDQGRKTLEASAAGRGTLRTGGTLKDILEYGNQFATQNYAGVDQRKFRNWQANDDTGFRNWAAADEQDFKTYTTNRDTAFGSYDRNYRGSLDSFQARRRGEEMDFQAELTKWQDRLRSMTSRSIAFGTT